MTWRDSLRPASFRGAGFKVEVGGQISGRRNVLHEYPKRDTPFPEDMGRRARQWVITAYIVGPDFTVGRDALLAAVEQGGPGTLVHPTLGSKTVVADLVRHSETRTRGGMCEFELTFTEYGPPTSATTTQDTQADVKTKADAAQAAAKTDFDNAPVSV